MSQGLAKAKRLEGEKGAPVTRGAFGFGVAPRQTRQRRRTQLVETPRQRADDRKLIEKFLAENPDKVVRCKTMFADGAVPTSGYYDF